MRSKCGLRRIDRITNAEIKSLCGRKVCIGDKMDQGVMRSIGQMERMGGDRLVKRVFDS